MINRILLMLLQPPPQVWGSWWLFIFTDVTYIDVQPEPAVESHDPAATSEEQPQPPNDTNEQQDVPASNDGNTES